MDNNTSQNQDPISELVLRNEKENGHRISDYTKLITIDGITQLNNAAKSYADSGCRNTWARCAIEELTVRLFKSVVTIAHLVEWDKEDAGEHKPVIDCLNDIASLSLKRNEAQNEAMNRFYSSGIKYEGD